MDSIALPPRIVGWDFAGWLRDTMRARGLSTRMLQLRTGIDNSTIYRLTLGQRQPNLATAIALLRVLGEGSAEGVTREA